mmetsp:Transcript_19913/g.64127  ORF Transcript_19913/g.64127 Transcript_19913/m.64127 type:complete len:159 (+) Transcript_19913:2401-2877(+)
MPLWGVVRFFCFCLCGLQVSTRALSLGGAPRSASKPTQPHQQPHQQHLLLEHPLEAVLVSGEPLETKLEAIGSYFQRLPLAVVQRVFEISASAAKMAVVWTASPPKKKRVRSSGGASRASPGRVDAAAGVVAGRGAQGGGVEARCGLREASADFEYEA